MGYTRDVVFTRRQRSSGMPHALVAEGQNIRRTRCPREDSARDVCLSSRGVGQEGWSRSTEYLKDAVEDFSRRWFPFPYPNAINVAGFSTGMEYPGIIFDGIHDQSQFLFWVTAHEIGHNWFPMIVGSNERRWAFMDEGFNTFIDIFESDDFEKGVYGPKRDSEYSAGGEPADTILKVLDDPTAPNILTRADGFTKCARSSGAVLQGSVRQRAAARTDR